jgi:predicted nucleic acid-binding protein
MKSHYGIDTSIFVRLLTGDPERDYQKTVARFEVRLTAQPAAEFFVSNQVIGEAYIALQHHYQVTKPEAKAAILSVLTSGLCTPLNGAPILAILEKNAGCGLLDRLIAEEYSSRNLTTLTNDKKMAKLNGAEDH